jgi:hypothetical protein
MSRRPATAVRLALAVVLSACASMSQAGVYKCVSGKGESVFQDTPCLPSNTTPAVAKTAHGPFGVQLLVVEHNADIQAWVLTPENLRKPDSARLRQVHRGHLLLVPIVVTNFTAEPTGAVRISADFQLISPTGTIALAKTLTGGSLPDARTPGLMVLNPVLNLTSEPTDPLGSYVVRVTVKNGVRTAQAEERFELVK